MTKQGPRLLRTRLHGEVTSALKRNPGVILIGPRQCGKTTLARTFAATPGPNYFDLEDPRHIARLDQPITALEALRGVVVIDEVQRRPDLFPVLRVLIDREPNAARFLLLGSASLDLLRQTSESLAGRVAVVSMAGFGVDEVGHASIETLWLRGGMPRSFLAEDADASWEWRRNYIQLLLERDVPQFGANVPPVALHRFWSMVAHSHGGIWSNSEPARSLGIAETTVRRYLDLLTGMLMLRQLQPWHENLTKRQVKAPKVYVRDSGLLHHFLGLRDVGELLGHPKAGSSWEGLVIEETLRAVRPDAAYFWATHGGAELDLLMFVRGKRLGVEVKRTDTPSLSRSMQVAMADLKLDALAVIYPGNERFTVTDGVEAVPFRAVEGEGPEAIFPRLLPQPKKAGSGGKGRSKRPLGRTSRLGRDDRVDKRGPVSSGRKGSA